jgi:hypothetical protein
LTDAEPIAGLAAQLEDLRGQLARTQGEVGYLKARAEEDSGQLVMYRLETKQQRERLDKALASRRLDPPPAPWWCVGEAEGRAMLAGLREWVDGFARRHYPGYLTRLRPCWANHPEAVWELSTLRAEWERVYADEDNRDLQGALAWYDKWLPGVLTRLETAIKCDAGCRSVPRVS